MLTQIPFAYDRQLAWVLRYPLPTVIVALVAGGLLARRIVRFASEDVGLADPQALPQALAAWDAYHRLGSPEGELPLAQAATPIKLDPEVLVKGLRATLFASSADEAKQLLTGVHLRLDAGALECAATDGHRLRPHRRGVRGRGSTIRFPTG